MMFRGRPWSSTVLNQRRASALRTVGRLSAYCGAGGIRKKRRCPSTERGGDPVLIRVLTFHGLPENFTLPWDGP